MIYDVIVIGAGSAGYPAGMYASRYGLKNLIIGQMPGGALSTSHKVENWPGVLSASGREIMNSFKDQAEKAGSEIINDKVLQINKNEDIFHLTTATGKVFNSKYVIVATGNKYKFLLCKGEREFMGKGVSFCATCDGMFFKGKDVVVVGGGNTALTEALYLSEICKKVYILHRRDEFRAEKTWVELASKKENIEFVLSDEIEEITGNFFVEKVLLKSKKELIVDGVFVAIGTSPNNEIVSSIDLKIDNDGYIIVDKRQETSIKGIYAAGDISTNSNKFRQTIMSAAEGCLAANSVHEDMLKNK